MRISKTKVIPKSTGMRLLANITGLYQLGVLDVSERNICAQLIKEGMHEGSEAIYKFLYQKQTESTIPLLERTLDLLDE